MPFTATHPEDAKPRQTGTDGLQPTHNRNLRRPRRGLLGGGLAILLPLLMAVGAARAQYFTPNTVWKSTIGLWHAVESWTDGVPTDSRYTYIDNNGEVSVIGNAQARNLFIRQGNLGVTEGTLSVTGDIEMEASNETQVGQSSFTVGVGGVVTADSLRIGDRKGTGKVGVVTVHDGGSLTTANATIGSGIDMNGSMSSAIVDGTGSSWLVNGYTGLSVLKGASLTVRAGGSLTVSQEDGASGINISSNPSSGLPNSKLTVTGAGSKVTFNADPEKPDRINVSTGGDLEILEGAELRSTGRILVTGSQSGGRGTLRISGKGSVVKLAGGYGTGRDTTGALAIGNGGGADEALVIVADGGHLEVGGNGVINSSTGTGNNRGILQIGDGGAAGTVDAELISTNQYDFQPTDPWWGTLTVRFSHTGEASLDALITKNVGVVKDGSGTARLTADNAYLRPTEVNAGTLLIDGDQSGAIGAVTVANGATLGGIGTLGGTVDVQAGGSLAGTLTLNKAVKVAGIVDPDGTLTFGQGLIFTGGEIVLDLESPLEFDALIGTGTLELGDGVVMLTLVSGANWEYGDTVTVFEGWSVIAGAFAQIDGTDLGDGLYWDTTKLLINGTLTVVPEPGVWMLLGLGALAGLAARLRGVRRWSYPETTPGVGATEGNNGEGVRECRTALLGFVWLGRGAKGRRWSAAAMALAGIIPCASGQVILFDNGPPDPVNGREITTFEQAQQFKVAEAATLMGIRFHSFEFFDSPAETVYGGNQWDGTLTYTIYTNQVTNIGIPINIPGIPLASGTGQSIVKTDLGLATVHADPQAVEANWFEYKFELAVPIGLEANTTYWLSIHLASDYATRDQIYWMRSSASSNVLTSGRARYLGIGSWGANVNEGKTAFQLIGASVPEPREWGILSAASWIGICLLRARRCRNWFTPRIN